MHRNKPRAPSLRGSNQSIAMARENYVKVNGIRTHYLESGPRNYDSLLFIHGLGSSADRWLDIPSALALYFHTIALDLPGSGLSDKPHPKDNFKYTIQDFADFIIQFIDKIKINGARTSLVGHSLGGYIAAQIALQAKGLVDRLVLIDSSGMLDGPTPLLKEYIAAAERPTYDSVKKVFEQMVAGPNRIPDLLVNGFIFRINMPGALDAFRAAYENSVNTQIGKKRLEQIRSETLIIWGMRDNLIPLEHCGIFGETIKNSKQIMVEDAGHAPFAEKPAVVCELLHRFFGNG
jgi:pimeloyl-ACP methyl ester carboxylesterase